MTRSHHPPSRSRQLQPCLRRCYLNNHGLTGVIPLQPPECRSPISPYAESHDDLACVPDKPRDDGIFDVGTTFQILFNQDQMCPNRRCSLTTGSLRTPVATRTPNSGALNGCPPASPVRPTSRKIGNPIQQADGHTSLPIGGRLNPGLPSHQATDPPTKDHPTPPSPLRVCQNQVARNAFDH